MTELAPFKGGPHRRDICRSCNTEIYLNLHPQRQVDQWAHRTTGGKYCDLTELTIAEPTQAEATA